MDSSFLIFIAAGFVAQMINGSLGMAYGLSLSALLLSFGLTPSASSSCIHLAELFTTGASGFCHWRLGNVDQRILKGLLLPGISGAVVGAYLLTHVPSAIIKPLIGIYLLFMGIRIFIKALNTTQFPTKRPVAPLGLVAGFLDAIAGGGWGSIVTSTLVARGHEPHLVIGSVNFARFFVTAATSMVLLASFGPRNLFIVIGLALGGLIASPLAAPLCKRFKRTPLMIAVAILVVSLSMNNLLKYTSSIADIYRLVTIGQWQ